MFGSICAFACGGRTGGWTGFFYIIFFRHGLLLQQKTSTSYLPLFLRSSVSPLMILILVTLTNLFLTSLTVLKLSSASLFWPQGAARSFKRGN